MNSLKKGEGVSLLNFEGGPGSRVLRFWVPGYRGPGVLVPLLHHVIKYAPITRMIQIDTIINTLYRYASSLVTYNNILEMIVNA